MSDEETNTGAPADDNDADASAKRRQQAFTELDRLLKFRHFLSASFEPNISDAEIIVCFADIRGFTNYCRTLQQEMQDRKIQNFLRTYVRIYAEGLLDWYLKIEEKPDGRDDAEAAKYVVPAMHKNLGDGMMLVWEVPSSIDITAQGHLSQNVIMIAECIQARFYEHFRDLSPVDLDAYSAAVEELHIGFGVAKGHAWRLDLGDSLDYAGSVINLASRLQDRARPSGIVAQYDVSNWSFDYVAGSEIGCIGRFDDLKGYSEVKVWLSPGVDSSQSGFTKLEAPPDKSGGKYRRKRT